MRGSCSPLAEPGPATKRVGDSSEFSVAVLAEFDGVLSYDAARPR